jgi:rod shape-determining protein MreD
VRRALTSAVLVFLALVIQLTMIDRLPLPGGITPDFVLLVVVGLALSGGPTAGMITGFCAGLALDVAPPSDHLMGAYALAFCLVGYCCGLVSAELDRSVLLPLAAAAVGAAVGAALYAGVGVMFGNPDVTGSAVRHVLPLSLLYDVVLSPFILYGVALANRLSATLFGVAASPAELGGSALGGSALGAQQPAAGGSLGSRPTPRIRAGSSRAGDGWIGGGGWLAASAELARTRRTSVRMRFGSGQAGSASQLRPSGAGGLASGKSAPKVKFGSGRRGDGVVAGGLRGAGFQVAGAGLFASLAGRGRPRLFSRRGRAAGSASPRFGRRAAWGMRTAASSGSSIPRKGAFNGVTGRKSVGSAATPRRGTFSASAPGRRTLSSGSPRRGAFSGGSSTKGSFGAGAPRRGAFGAPRRLRALRRATLRRATLRGSSLGGRKSSLGGRKGALGGGKGTLGARKGALGASRRSSSWRIRHKRNGGFR